MISMQLISSLENNRCAIAFAQGLYGRFVIILLSGFLIALTEVPHPELVAGAVAAIILLPSWRDPLLLIATVSGWLLVTHDYRWPDLYPLLSNAGVDWGKFLPATTSLLLMQLLILSLALASCYGILLWAGRRGTQAPRRPLQSLLLGAITLLLAASYLPLGPLPYAILWSYLLICAGLFGYLCYGVLDRHRCQVPLWRQLSLYLPFWSLTPIPYPKGPHYLFSRLAAEPEPLAVSRLKGVKLLLWAAVLTQLQGVFNGLFYGQGELIGGALLIQSRDDQLSFTLPALAWVAAARLPLPAQTMELVQSVNAFASGVQTPVSRMWATIATEFFRQLLALMVWGHALIGIVRLLGFNVFRNTYRPLQATSIADFYGRYDYYFKEFLFNLLYFPLILRLNGMPIWLRSYLALILTMLIGNFGLHVYLENMAMVGRLGVIEIIVHAQVYLFYCLVLATGIFLSQINPARRSNPGVWARWRGRLLVCLFFALLNIFGDLRATAGLEAHLAYLLALFGINL